MRRTIVAALAGTAVLVGAAPAAAEAGSGAGGAGPAATSAGAPASLTVVTRGAFVTRIGRFRPSENPRLSAAIAVFGRPSSRRERGAGACTVRWRRLGLKINFANLGAPGSSTCSPSIGRAQSFVARGTRFVTVAGLRPGQPSTQIRALYPDAEYERGAWTLVSAASPFGDGSESPVLRAFTRGGRVASLAGWIGGAGE